MSTRLGWREFSAELLALYSTSRRSPATRTKMGQVLREVGELVEFTTDLTPTIIGQWIDRYPERAAITRNGLLSYLRKASRYLVARRYLEANPFEAFSFRARVPKSRRKRHLSRAEVRVLLDHLAVDQTWQGRRLFALTVLLCHTGLRAKEALRLKVCDLDFDRGTVAVVARFRLKTEDAEATIPLPPGAIPALREWSGVCGSEWLFPGNRLEGPWVHGTNGVRPTDHLRRASIAAGLQPTTMLMLRHTLATHARTHFGLSAETTRQILRHAVASTQQHYIGEDWDHLRSVASRIQFDDVAPSPH